LQCVYCGLDGKRDLHAFRQLTWAREHLVPRVLGGDDSESNRVTCCWACNRAKGKFDPRDKTPTGRDNDTPRDRMIEKVKEQLRGHWDHKLG
jgi:5-methylcytosine-specific restriction endonuclease McrA